MGKPKSKIDTVVITEYINKVKTRGSGGIGNVPFMSDDNWRDAQELVHKRGPLSDVEKISYFQQHNHFAQAHFLDLVFELELAYKAIKVLSHE